MKAIRNLAVLIAQIVLCASSYGSLVANLNTGIDANNDGMDDHWSLAAVTPGNPAPPAGLSLPNAYVTTSGWPLAPTGPWLANDSTSKWITYASPIWTGAEATYDYTYRLVFETIGGQVPVRWLSDNGSTMYLDAQWVGAHSDAGGYALWSGPLVLNVTPGMHTLDVVVNNVGQPHWGNPTGVRVEFPDGVPVPEPATVIFGALLLVPVGLSILRRPRRQRA